MSKRTHAESEYCGDELDDDSVLSEVHASDPNLPSCTHLDSNKVVQSRFEFALPASQMKVQVNIGLDEEMDIDSEDHDIDVTRCRINHEVIFINHRMATPVKHVACQVWLGALLLGDYVLDNAHKFRNKDVVELGCGVGLTSLALAYVGANVTATDMHSEALQLLESNVKLNSSLLTGGHKITTKMFNWNESETVDSQFPTCSYILAADVIYDEQINLALFEQFETLGGKKKTILISTEQRINFCANTLKEHSPSYDNFVDWMNYKQINSGWKCSQIMQDNINQYFNYDRNCFLELWIIETR